MKYSTLFILCLICFATGGQKTYTQLTERGYEELGEGDALNAKHHLEKALLLLPKKLTLDEKATFYNNLGVAYYQSGEFKKGIDNYTISLECYRKMKNDSLIAGALHNLGLAYKEIGLYHHATKELIRASRIFEKNGSDKELSSAWNGIGNIQRKLGNFNKALAYHFKALVIRQRINYDKGIADSYHNIGSVYLDLQNYTKAESYLQDALKLKHTLHNQANELTTLTLLGQLYVEKKESEKAFYYLNKAYNLRLESGNSAKTASSLYYLGTYYASVGNPIKAFESFQQSENLSKLADDHQLLADVLLSEIELLKKQEKNNILLQKYQELIEARELITTEENRKNLARLEIAYDVERKNRELQARRKQIKLDRIQIENQQLRNQQLVGWLVGSVIFTCIIAGILYQLRLRKKRIEIQNTELEGQKEEIIHLHHELSHRTKNYFGMLSGILKSDKSNVENAEAIKVLEENIRRLEAMSLVQHYLLDDSTKRNKEVRLDAYLDKLIDLLLLNLFPHGGKLLLIKELKIIYLDYDIAMRLAIVLNELLCNAIEHGLENIHEPELLISVDQNGNKIILLVKDNGSGIAKQLSKTTMPKGLSLIPKLLQKVNGTIHHNNENGCVATVTITL